MSWKRSSPSNWRKAQKQIHSDSSPDLKRSRALIWVLNKSSIMLLETRNYDWSMSVPQMIKNQQGRMSSYGWDVSGFKTEWSFSSILTFLPNTQLQGVFLMPGSSLKERTCLFGGESERLCCCSDLITLTLSVRNSLQRGGWSGPHLPAELRVLGEPELQQRRGIALNPWCDERFHLHPPCFKIQRFCFSFWKQDSALMSSPHEPISFDTCMNKVWGLFRTL